MEISKTGYVNQLYQNENANTQKQNTNESLPAQTESKKSEDVVNISSSTKDLQLASEAAKVSDTERTERVDQLKQAYESGNYSVNAEQVANKMLGSIISDTI